MTDLCQLCGKVGPDTPWGPSYGLCDHYRGYNEYHHAPDPPKGCFIGDRIEAMYIVADPKPDYLTEET